MSGLAGNTLDGKVDIQSFKQQREIRVFISSTFKDMVKERDELIKYTFPRLRKMCEERGISWSEVDLRWGVTSEQSAEGKVLPICLKEIKNCLPFFIGILGERYGWIPEITHELIQEYPWLEKHVGKSVTELEILQGALLYNNEEENINAFFYFRDPKYIHSVREEEKKNFIEMIDEEELKHISPNEDIQQLVEDRTEKLAHLKDQIRESQYHVREDFSSAKELGGMVYSDLSKLINEIFPKDVPEDELERRAIEQETFAFMKSKVFRGRDKYLEEMTKHIDNDNPVPLVITGESGAGKSALLSKWFLNIQPNLKAQKIPYIIHFIGAGSRDGDVSDLLRRMIMELNRKFNLDVPIPVELDELREAFAFALDLAAEYGKLVLVIDSIDQLNNEQWNNEQLDENLKAQALFWLPTVIPKNVRLIISTTEGKELEEFRNRGWSILTLNLLNETEIQLIINSYLSSFGKNMEDGFLKSILYHPHCKNPLFLSTLLDEIRVDGDKGLYDKVLDYVNSKDIEDLFLKKIERLEIDYGQERPGLVKDALSLLWASRNGLSEAELLDLLGNGEKLTSSIWSPFYLAMESNFVKRSGFICLFHQFLRAAVEKKYLPSEKDKKYYHNKIAEYFHKNKLILSQKRILQELPWQLMKAKEWYSLYSLLQDFSFVSPMWNYDPYIIKSYWVSLEENTKPWKQGFIEELTLKKAFQKMLETPELFEIEELKIVGKLLESKYIDESLKIQYYLRKYYKECGEVDHELKVIENITNLYKLKSDYDHAMTLLQEQQAIARDKNMLDIIQSNLGSQAEIHIYRGEYGKALPLLQEQERINQYEIDHPIGLQQALGNQAKIKYYQMEYEETLSLLAEKERICLNINHKNGIQEVIGLRGLVSKSQEKYETALELFEVQEELTRSLGNMKDLQECLINQAETLYQLDPQNKDSINAILGEQEIICYNINNKNGLQLNYGLRARIHQDGKSFDTALKLLERQEKICRELENKVSLQECLGRQVFLLKKKNQYQKALKKLDEQERICRQYHYLTGLQICLGNKISILKMMGRIYDCVTLTDEQEQICIQIDNKRGLFYTCGSKAWLLRRFGKDEEALEYLKKQELLAIELDFNEGLGQALYEQGNIYAFKGEFHKALELYERCKEIAEDEKKYNHAQSKQELIMQIMNNTKEANENKESMDLYNISSVDIEVLKIIAKNGNIIFSELLRVANEFEGFNLTNAKLTTILFTLKKKALIFTVKRTINGTKKAIYELTDWGLDRLEEVTGEVIPQVDVSIRDVAQSQIQDYNQTEKWIDLICDIYSRHEVVVNQEKLIFQVKGLDSTQSILFVNKDNIQELATHLDELSANTKDFYLLARNESYLHSQVVVEFYRWLKERYKKIPNARGIIHVYISYLEDFEKDKAGDITWKKLIF